MSDAGPLRSRKGFLERPLRRLLVETKLSDLEQRAVRDLRTDRVVLAKGLEPAPKIEGVFFILDGWACEARVLTGGRRQIFNLLLPGDVAGCLPDGATIRYQPQIFALTRVIAVDAGSLCGLEAIHQAMAEAQRNARNRTFDHIVRLGSHTAYESVAHLLLEVHGRLAEVGLASDGRFELPIGQDQIGQLLGLSGMHVNRTMAKLKGAGWLKMGPGWVALPRLSELAELVDYGPTSLDERPRTQA